MSSILSTHATRRRIKAKPGRPPVFSAGERSRRILAAAEEIFSSEGYGAATMEAISRTAGMSKRTVYGLFPDKDRLLVALVSDSGAFPVSRATPRAAAITPRQELRDHLLAMIEFMLLPRQVCLTRLLISEASRSPTLAHEFHEQVMRKGQVYLTEGLLRLKEAEPGVSIDNPEYLSMTLFSAALGDLHIRALLGNPAAVNNEQLLARIDFAIGIVLPEIGDNGERGDGVNGSLTSSLGV